VGQHLFGYSFATWRFHLRGIKLKGAYDIGWLRDLTVDRLMRRDPRVVASSLTLAEFEEQFPLGSAGSVFVVDDAGRYQGSVDVAKIHDVLGTASDKTKPVGSLVAGEPPLLLPSTSVRAAIDIFGSSAQEELAVVDSGKDRRIIGYLSEASALRRYSQELERRRAEEQGGSAIFAPEK
jgi:CIC family chloride channel protein